MPRHLWFLAALAACLFALNTGCPTDDDDDTGDDDSGDDDATDDDDDTGDDDSTGDDDTADDDSTGDDDTTTVSVFGDVQATVFDVSCAATNCHGQAASANLDLRAGNSYDDLVDVASFGLPSMVRVAPGELLNSYAWHKLQGTQGDVGGTGQQMPVGGSLGTAELDLIEQWISTGAAP